MIYLKRNKEDITSCCDLETLFLMTGTREADLEISDDDWDAAGYCAHCEGESIILGPALDKAQSEKKQEINIQYEAALTATLTMPAEKPSPAEIALATLDFQLEDAEGLAYVRALLAARRDELLAQVDAATTGENVTAIAVAYPV